MNAERWLIVGLGNPGATYAANRHNVGFMVLETLAERVNARFKAHRSRAQIAECRLGDLPGRPVVLAKPMTFMNLSGTPVAGLRDFFKVSVERIVVVHDELDLPFGTVRVKRGGGAAGHNGLRSITQSIGSPDYLRVRCGIGRPPGRQQAADFVLADFSPTQRRELPLEVERAADAAAALVERELPHVQNEFH